MEGRRKRIVELVNQEQYVSFQRLREEFPDVSDVTLRKDLSFLDSTLQLVRVHGGAKSLPTAIGMIDNFYARIVANTEAKKEIARKAANLLCENDAFYIASGSTCNEFTKALPDIPMLVFTDGIATALELSKFSKIKTSVFGGILNPHTLRVQGPKLFSELSNLHFNYSFLSSDGFSRDQGFIYCDPYFGTLLETLRNHTDKMVIMLDSSKVDSIRAPYRYLCTNVDIVVSDGNLDAATIRSMTQAGIVVL